MGMGWLITKATRQTCHAVPSVFPVIMAGYYTKIIHQLNVAYAATCCFYDLNNHQCHKHESVTANNSKRYFQI